MRDKNERQDETRIRQDESKSLEAKAM